MSGEKLLPCPFCGGEAKRIDIEEEGENFGGSCISCKRCLASSNLEFGRKENFVSNWNRRASGWQPIESAPKDGPVLLYFGNRIWRDIHGNTVSFGEARDDVERTEPALCKDGDILESGTAHSVWEEWRGPENFPTHWMPLPPTPQGEG